MNIRREDMLELTRRMTTSRTHIGRVAGAYFDEEGAVDGTFHVYLSDLPASERKHVLQTAHDVLISRTNDELRGYALPKAAPGSIWQLLAALLRCGLRNDALLLALYEHMGDCRRDGLPFAVNVFYGSYDVPVKGADREWLEGSEEVYDYLIAAVCPCDEDLRTGPPLSGFLWPAFTDRSTDKEHLLLFARDASPAETAFWKRVFAGGRAAR